jgi:hypothetical protein
MKQSIEWAACCAGLAAGFGARCRLQRQAGSQRWIQGFQYWLAHHPPTRCLRASPQGAGAPGARARGAPQGVPRQHRGPGGQGRRGGGGAEPCARGAGGAAHGAGRGAGAGQGAREGGAGAGGPLGCRHSAGCCWVALLGAAARPAKLLAGMQLPPAQLPAHRHAPARHAPRHARRRPSARWRHSRRSTRRRAASRRRRPPARRSAYSSRRRRSWRGRRRWSGSGRPGGTGRTPSSSGCAVLGRHVRRRHKQLPAICGAGCCWRCSDRGSACAHTCDCAGRGGFPCLTAAVLLCARRAALEAQIRAREAAGVVDDTDMSPRDRQVNAPLLRLATNVVGAAGKQ